MKGDRPSISVPPKGQEEMQFKWCMRISVVLQMAFLCYRQMKSHETDKA
jgi:hypothetical protein